LIKTSGQEAAFEILKVDNPFSTSQKITQIVEERAKSQNSPKKERPKII